jgi:hypothetical protein
MDFFILTLSIEKYPSKFLKGKNESKSPSFVES